MIAKCDFCGTKHLPITRYRCAGRNFEDAVSTTVSMCVCCSANTDETWLAEELGWDSVIKVEPIKE